MSVMSLPSSGSTVWAFGVSGVGLEDFDGTLWAGGSGEAAIPGEQGSLQGFGEGDIGGVVDGEVVPQFPTASQQGGMAHALEREFSKVIQSEPDSTWVQVAAAGQSSPHRGDLEIDQRRGGELFPVQPIPGRVSVGAVRRAGRRPGRWRQ